MVRVVEGILGSMVFSGEGQGQLSWGLVLFRVYEFLGLGESYPGYFGVAVI